MELFMNQNEHIYGSGFTQGHRAMANAWNELPSSKKERYVEATKRRRATFKDKHHVESDAKPHPISAKLRA